jgi:hypothetical protein
VLLCIRVSLCSLAVAGCSRQRSIVGTWTNETVSKSRGVSASEKFEADGKFEIRATLPRGYSSITGTYTAIGDTLTLVPLEGTTVTGSQAREDGQLRVFRINWRTVDSMQLISAEGVAQDLARTR